MSHFYSILALLRKYSPIILARAIGDDRIDLYFRNDTLGSVKKAKDDGDAWQCRRDPVSMQKIIVHTEDEKKASVATKSRALVLLEMCSSISDMKGLPKHPMKQAYSLELGNFGWPKDSLPDFETIKQKKTTLISAQKDTTDQNPPAAIIPIKELKSKDDWYLIIRAAIKDFEKHNEQTPSREILWRILIAEPPKGWDVAYESRKRQLTMPGSKPLDRDAFNKRYKRYYRGNVR